jgi:hypothetical protein
MPKQVFWPAALVTMGLIFLASNMGYLPSEFWNLWPIILIVVGLGGLLTADRSEWLVFPSRKNVSKKTATKKSARKK